VLVVIYSADGQALLLRRVQPFDFWQSVTGSLQHDEDHAAAARRELFEETGLREEGELVYSGMSRQYVIDPRWRHKFEPDAVENVEFEWHFRVPAPVPVKICAREHSEFRWLPIAEAAALVWSWTNRDALSGLRL